MIVRPSTTARALLLSCCLLAAALAPASPLAAQTSGAAEQDAVREEFLKINYVFNRKLYSLAIPEYERFLKKHPDFKDVAFVHYALALCHYNLATQPQAATSGTEDGAASRTKASLREAIKHLKEALPARGFESRAEATQLLGQCLLLAEDYRNAASAFRWVAERGESGELEAAANLGLAEALYHQGEHGEAASTYRTFLAKPTESAADRSRARFYLAMSLYHEAASPSAHSTTAGPTLSPTAESLAIFEELAGAADDPYRDDARYMAALIQAEQGQHERAAQRFDELVRGGSKVYAERALFGLGSASFQQGAYADAVKTLQRFGKAFPRSARLDEARLLEARAQLKLGRQDVALEHLGKLKTSAVIGDQACLILARQLAEAGAHEEAVAVASQALRLFPESPFREDLELELALCEVAGERFGPAATTLAGFQARYPDSRSSDHASYLLAYSLHRNGQAAESLAVCRAFRRKHPGSDYLPEVLQLEAENAFRVGEYRAAREAYETYLANTGRDRSIDEVAAARTRVRIAQALYQEREYGKALAALEQGEPPAAPPEDSLLLSYHYYVGECAYQLRSYPRASGEFATYLERVRAAAPAAREALEIQTQDARFKVAHSLQLAGDLKGAREAYGAALRNDPENPHREQIHFELGQLEYTDKNFDVASGHLRALVEDHPKSTFVPHALFYLGSMAFDAADYEGATVYFERIVGEHAESSIAADAEYQLAISLLAGGHDERARAVRARMSERHPDDPRLGNILLEEAVVASRAGRPEAALAILTPLEADPNANVDRARVLYEMAWCYRKLERVDEAVATYEKLLATFDERAGDSPKANASFANAVRLEHAELEFDRKRYEKAKTLLAPLAASARDASLEGALYRLCWSHHMLGEAPETVTVFHRFEAEFPASDMYPELALLAAKALLAQSKPGPAGDLFRTIATRFPDGKDADLALVSYGECRLEERRFKEARTVFQDALARFPDSDVGYRARFGLGWASENLGNHEEAKNQYRQVIATTSTATAARAQFQIGQCFVAAKDYGRAVVEFLKVPASYRYEEWNARSLLQVAGCFEALDDREKAQQYYEEVATTFGNREEGKLARERLRKLEID